MLAAPEIALQDGEARQLAMAIKEVERHYKLPALAADKLALATLAWVAGRIYIPKGIAYAARKGIAKPAPGGPGQTKAADAARPTPAVTDWFDPDRVAMPN